MDHAGKTNSAAVMPSLFQADELAPYDYEERDSYHLQDNIDAEMAGGGGMRITVYAEAVSPENGFDYLDVTRFGRGPTHAQTAKKMRWPGPGGWIFRTAAGPWSPGSDWVTDAAYRTDRYLDDAEEEIAREIERQIL